MRQIRMMKERMIEASPSRSTVVAEDPISGNRVLAKETPVVMEIMASMIAPGGRSSVCVWRESGERMINSLP